MAMKQRILRYFGAMLVVICVLGSVLLLSDLGYVYIYIWHWQIQTSLLFLIGLSLILLLMVYVIAQILKKLHHRQIQQKQHIQHFQQFYRYEQSGILYLLQTHYSKCEHQFKIMRDIYQPSMFLKPLIKAHIAYQHQYYEKAIQHLKWVVPSCFELKELQLIQIYLAQHNAEKSLTHLLVLEHPKQAWLNDLQENYHIKLERLWADFAIQFPILYLQQQHTQNFTHEEWCQFSQSLLNKLKELNSSPIELEQLQFLQKEIQQYRQASVWYQIFKLIDSPYAEQFFDQVMQQQFDETLFKHWFTQHSTQWNAIMPKIQQWQKQYPSLPCLQFALILIYLQQQRYAEVCQILEQPSQHRGLQYLQQHIHYLEDINVLDLWALLENN